MHRPLAPCGNHRAVPRPGFDDDISKSFDPAGTDQNVGGGQEVRRIVPPAKKDNARADTKLCCKRLQRRLFRPRSGDPEMRIRHPGKSPDQDIKRLVFMQPAESEKQRRVLRCSKRGTVKNLARRRIDKVRQVMRPLCRPALPRHMIDQTRRVADQMIEAAIIFDVVITTDPARPDIVARRGFRGGPVHPGQHDIRCEGADILFQPPRRQKIKRPAKTVLGEIDARRAHNIRPALIPADCHALCHGRAALRLCHGGCQPFEKHFGAAVARACHGLIKSDHPNIGKACDNEAHCGVAGT